MLFQGALITFIGDTPANNRVGGFKESVSRSFRICRQCLATNQDVQEKVSTSYFFKYNKKLLIMITLLSQVLSRRFHFTN